MRGYAATGLVFLLYLATLSRDYAADGIQTAQMVETGNLLVLLDPYHLLIGPLAWGFYKLWQLAGWTNGALLPLQVLNALGGAFCVGLFYSIVHHVTQSTRTALLTAAGFAVSCGVWLFSTDAEFVTVPLAAMLLVLWGILAVAPKWQNHPAYAVALGLGTGIATFVYLTSLFLVPVVIVGFLLIDGQSWRIRPRQILLFLLVVVLAVAAYLQVVNAAFGIHSFRGLLALFSGSGLYGQMALRNLPHGAYAFLRTLGGFPGLGLNGRTTLYLSQATWPERALFVAYYAALLVVAIAPLAMAIAKRRQLLQSHRRALGVMLTWTLVYSAFAVYWVPGDMTFWLPTLVAWWLLMGLVLVVSRSGSIPVFKRGLRPGSVVAGLVALLFIVNSFGIILFNRDIERNRDYQITMSIAERTTGRDLLVTTGGDRLFLYLPYFADRRVVSVFHAVRGYPSKKEGFAALDREIAQVQANGGRVFLVGVQPGRDVWWDVLGAGGVTRDDFGRFSTQPAWEAAGEQVLEILPR